MGQLKPIFPIPTGGMTLDRLPEMAEVIRRGDATEASAMLREVMFGG